MNLSQNIVQFKQKNSGGGEGGRKVILDHKKIITLSAVALDGEEKE